MILTYPLLCSTHFMTRKSAPWTSPTRWSPARPLETLIAVLTHPEWVVVTPVAVGTPTAGKEFEGNTGAHCIVGDSDPRAQTRHEGFTGVEVAGRILVVEDTGTFFVPGEGSCLAARRLPVRCRCLACRTNWAGVSISA